MLILMQGMVPRHHKYQTYAHGKSLVRALPPIYNPHTKDAITLEHIVPKSILLNQPHTDASLAVKDLHNVFACGRTLNQARGCLRFSHRSFPAQDHVMDLRHVEGANFIDRKQEMFCVNPHFRGLVARAVLHMAHCWGCPTEEVVSGGEQTLWKWHRAHPPSTAEMLHNYLVLRTQNTTNMFISNCTDHASLLEEMHETQSGVDRCAWPRDDDDAVVQ